MKYTETESLKLQIRKLETLRQRDERELKRQKTYKLSTQPTKRPVEQVRIGLYGVQAVFPL